ncbi:cytochrome P450 [Pseudarthrobacter sp. NamB4]|uniref:cytochrome P450 n=1 Tax=Pseudarthrobacter sp. NamB4 TaxID=2576837 RepID=UPI0010FF0507|nr:cytochrome P450 [Pseudarthrobacter sp. NamB4]TLM72912.1 cytochrome P450 [Pseudarthrobacter sp. NamB4]
MNAATPLPTASARDTTAFLLDVLIPTAAKGPLMRRPRVEALAERLNLDRRAVTRMQKLEEKYPGGPLLLRLPIRKQAVVLLPEHLHAVLAGSPEPFSPASSEKRGALAHFQPRNVLISTGGERTARRALQEQALDTNSPVHRLASSFLPVVYEEADALLASIGDGDGATTDVLDWDLFITSWLRIIRRVIFGDGARDDNQLTDMLARLRKDANWSALKPQRRKTRDEFLRRVQSRINTAAPGSLASVMRGISEQDPAAPRDQVPQWLFAFDTSGTSAFRALALLSAHDEAAKKAREEIDADTTGGRNLPFLRATVLETVRLWPNTPMILRQTTTEVTWDNGTMPAKCGLLIFAPYFHRDGRRLPQADTFDPGIWLQDDVVDVGAREDWGLVPFSAGPASCPGRHLVLLLTSALLARLLQDTSFTLEGASRLSPSRPLPGSLDNFSLRFSPRPR